MAVIAKTLRIRMGVKQAAFVLLLSLMLPSAYAHHSVPVNFDMKSDHSVTGVLTEIAWRNPHSHLVLEVKTDDGANEKWLVEWNAVNTIRRLSGKLGFSLDDFVIGETITVQGWIGRHDKSIYLRSVTFEDGRRVEWRTRLSPAEQSTK